MRATVLRVATGVCLTAGVALFGVGYLEAGSASAQYVGQVPICHRDDSVDSPYAPQTISTNAAYNRLQSPPNNVVGVFPTMPWGDIIPPFVNPNNTSEILSLNWTGDGPAIWANGCDADLTPETTTTTTTPGESTTTASTTPGESTTTASTTPGESTTTASTTPGESTTTASTTPGETTTPGQTTTTTSTPGGTAPPPTGPPGTAVEPDPPFPTDPPNGSDTLPPTEAEVQEPNGNDVDLGTLDPTENGELESDLDNGATNDGDADDQVSGATGAQTGKPFGAEEIAGTALVAAGAGGLLLLRRKTRRSRAS